MALTTRELDMLMSSIRTRILFVKLLIRFRALEAAAPTTRAGKSRGSRTP